MNVVYMVEEPRHYVVQIYNSVGGLWENTEGFTTDLDLAKDKADYLAATYIAKTRVVTVERWRNS